MADYIDKVIEQVKNGFQKNKGRGSCYILKPVNPFIISYCVICSIKDRDTNRKILVITDSYNSKITLTDCFTVIPEQNRSYYTNNLTILTKDFVKPNFIKNYNYDFVLTLGLNTIKDIEIIEEYTKISKFMLTIITENKFDKEFIDRVRAILPDINLTINADKVEQDRILSPVEEIRLPSVLDDKDRILYEKYNNFIKDSMSIFKDLDTVNKCRVGDPSNHLSASDVRTKIAFANGWSYDMDGSVAFNKQIDAIYNPNAIAERAETVYNIIRSRRDLVLSNENKLPIILDIVSKELNNNRKVLIISKQGEFAAKITKYLNKQFDNFICGDYHDCIEDSSIIDTNTGKPMVYKSGNKKGEIRIFKSKALSSLYMDYYNKGNINVLSIKNSSSNDLKIVVNTIILTSSLLDNIFAIKTRFSNIEFTDKITKCYKVYTENTIEEQQMLNEDVNPLIKVINPEINININNDEITI